jgi:hypothetical protein
MCDLQFLCSPQFNSWFCTSLRSTRSLFYQTTLGCHLLSVYSINMARSADRPKAQRSDDGNWRTVVVGRNNIISLLELVGTISDAFIYKTQKGKWLYDLRRKTDAILPTQHINVPIALLDRCRSLYLPQELRANNKRFSLITQPSRKCKC